MKYSRGMSLLEILLAIAMATFFVMSSSVYIYSLHPNNILRDILGGDIKKEWIHPKIWNDIDVSTHIFTSNVVDEEIQGYKTCNDFDISKFSTQYYTSKELGVSTTSLPTGIGSVGDILYVSFNSSSTTEPDLVIYKKELSSLVKISELNTGPGAADMKVIGLTAFLANTSVTSQIQKVDVSDEYHPKLIRSYVIPGSNSVTSPISKKIFVYKNLVFVGTEKSTLPELYSFNIETGVPISSVNTDYGINGIFVKDGKIYILSPKDPEVDIFDMVTMNKVSSFDAPQSLGNGRSLSTTAEHMFLGRSRGDDELYDITNISHQHIGASVDHVLTTLHTLYAFTSSPLQRILSFDISSSLLSHASAISLPERISSVQCVSDGIYLALQSTSTPLVKLTEHI